MRTVKVDKHQKFAADHHMSHHFVSAKTGDSVSVNVAVPTKLPVVYDLQMSTSCLSLQSVVILSYKKFIVQ